MLWEERRFVCSSWCLQYKCSRALTWLQHWTCEHTGNISLTPSNTSRWTSHHTLRTLTTGDGGENLHRPSDPAELLPGFSTDSALQEIWSGGALWPTSREDKYWDGGSRSPVYTEWNKQKHHQLSPRAWTPFQDIRICSFYRVNEVRYYKWLQTRFFAIWQVR